MTDREYVGHWDFPPGKDATVTIKEVKGGELYNPESNTKSKKPIIYFEGKEKGFVCNVTNAKTIESFYGPLTEDWIGKKITLYTTQTHAKGGDMVDCIRVRPRRPE